jgi:hypothetical protein
MKYAVFWDVAPCGCVFRSLVTANVVPSSSILLILIIEAISSSKMSAHTSATRRNIPDDGILHIHRREIPKSYIISSESLKHKIARAGTIRPS